MGLLRMTIALSIALSAQSAFADAITLSGSLADSTNTKLKAADLGAALFGTDNEIANNVAIYLLTINQPGIVTFKSTGFALGGIDPYFSLFEGAGIGAS